MTKYRQSSKLNNVLYDIRGPILEEANRMEAMGHRILKLNIGNTAPFGFEAPDAIMMDIIRHLPVTQGYSDSRGLYSARTAIVQHYQNRGILDLEPNDVYLGNGVSELIPMTLQALCETDDEILVPMPDYPLWTASVALSGGKPVHYLCDEENNWYPDLEDIKSKITSRTKGIVVINPNNPTGSVYPRHILQQIVDVAREHELVVFTDEIYEKIIYDGAEAINLATLTGDDVLCLTFSGLSKAYRVCGYRAGWVAITGPKHEAANYIEGITLLASMRLCSNVPAQHAIQTALGGYQSIDALVAPGGRLHEQRDVAYRMLNEIDGISCNQSDGALYLFPKVDTEKFNIVDDEKFMLDLLKEQKILFSHGGAFNWHKPDHFRLVFLPDVQTLTDALNRLGEFLSDYKHPRNNRRCPDV